MSVPEIGKPGVSKGTLLAVLGIAVVAIVLSATALAASFVLPARRAPQTQKFTIVLGEGEIIWENATTGQDEVTGEYHRWEPSVLVVNKGDTVELTIKNPRKHYHSFVLTAFGQDTGALAPKTGQAVVSFVADKAGVFEFRCGVAYSPGTDNCDPDHGTMVGYLVVLE